MNKTTALIILLLYFFAAGSSAYAFDRTAPLKLFYSEKTWEETAFIVTNKEGKERLYISSGSKLLQDIKTVESWSSSGNTLAISGIGGNVFFTENSCSSHTADLSEFTPLGFMQNEQAGCLLPLEPLLKGLNISLTLTNLDDSYQAVIKPAIIEISQKKSGTSIIIESALKSQYEIKTLDNNEAAIFIKDAVLTENTKWDTTTVFTEKETTEEGTILKFKLPHNRKIPFNVPREASKIEINFLPDFNLLANYAGARLKKASFSNDQFIIEADAPFQYFWNYDEDKRLLTLEIPLMTPEENSLWQENIPENISIEFVELGYGIMKFSFNTGNNFLIESTPQNGIKLTFDSTGENDKLKGVGASGLPLREFATIVIDPGHGGCDAGACNALENVREKTVNLTLAKELGSYLKNYGYNVIYTRTTDKDVSWANSPDATELQARTDVANSNSATIFVSVHCNASTNKNIKGFSVYWTKEQDYKLAKIFEKNFITPSLQLKNRGVFRGNYYILRRSRMPAIIIETCFISNNSEAKKLKDKRFQTTIMKDVAKVLHEYLSSSQPKSRVITL